MQALSSSVEVLGPLPPPEKWYPSLRKIVTFQTVVAVASLTPSFPFRVRQRERPCDHRVLLAVEDRMRGDG